MASSKPAAQMELSFLLRQRLSTPKASPPAASPAGSPPSEVYRPRSQADPLPPKADRRSRGSGAAGGFDAPGRVRDSGEPRRHPRLPSAPSPPPRGSPGLSEMFGEGEQKARACVPGCVGLLIRKSRREAPRRSFRAPSPAFGRRGENRSAKVRFSQRDISIPLAYKRRNGLSRNSDNFVKHHLLTRSHREGQ